MANISFVALNVAFDLIESSSEDGLTAYRVMRNESEIGEVWLPSYLNPRTSVGANGIVAIYCGGKAYFIKDRIITLSELDDEIHTVWILKEGIVLECELSIILLSYGFAQEKKYEHEDVIMSAYMEGDVVVFKDWEQRIFELCLKDFDVCRLSD